MRTRSIAVSIGAAIALMSAAGCGNDSGSNPLATGSSSSATGGSGSSSITVGSADFPESVLLAEIYAGALKAKGVTVNKKLSIGSRETYIPALQDGSIDLIPEYTGVLTQYFNKAAKATDAEGVYAELKASPPDTLTVLDKSAAEDKDSVAVTKETAYGVGVNWYPWNTVKLSLNYELTSFEGGAATGDRPDEQALFSRFAINY